MFSFSPVAVSEQCGNEVNHLVCSLTSFVNYWKTECPGKEDVESCSTCQIQAAKTYEENSWIMTCTIC